MKPLLRYGKILNKLFLWGGHINEITLRFYEILGILNLLINEPMINLSRSVKIPVLAVLLLGILGSTAPCQITTSLGAAGFIMKDGKDRHKLISNYLWYVSGKLIIFFIYGLLIAILGSEVQKASIPLFGLINKYMGPILILIGLNILGVINLRGSFGSTVYEKIDGYIKKFNNLNPSFVMGAIFSLAFCPTLFWLFFGLVMPISLKTTYGLILPVFFALGTLVPLTIIMLSISIGKSLASHKLKQVRTIQKVFRILGGILLILIGIFDSLVYWFA